MENSLVKVHTPTNQSLKHGKVHVALHFISNISNMQDK